MFTLLFILNVTIEQDITIVFENQVPENQYSYKL